MLWLVCSTVLADERYQSLPLRFPILVKDITSLCGCSACGTSPTVLEKCIHKEESRGSVVASCSVSKSQGLPFEGSSFVMMRLMVQTMSLFRGATVTVIINHHAGLDDTRPSNRNVVILPVLDLLKVQQHEKDPISLYLRSG
ncbi:hypothetical protein HZH68_008110 [Vespula germanica]|uniref:Uncharacterized protein n=1 Tax=Vespula germanica TaxID=30212 RepID=A0A834K3D6_VESGE|nr:hypothetical protein HZH68_008110 [Vespula germanica]